MSRQKDLTAFIGGKNFSLGNWLRAFVLWTLGIAAVVGILWVVGWWTDPVRRLRTFGTEVHDYRPGPINFTGDYVRYVSCKCSEVEFHNFARQEGLSERASGPLAHGFGWPCLDQPWWDSSLSCQDAYFSFEHGRTLRIMQYAHGRLYYYSSQT